MAIILSKLQSLAVKKKKPQNACCVQPKDLLKEYMTVQNETDREA